MRAHFELAAGVLVLLACLVALPVLAAAVHG